ncbi:MAG: hypothetical protein M3Q08_04805 [Pseudomonadota bacterium]|nr:hypothetical protein [Pseudomonadota bacterium]
MPRTSTFAFNNATLGFGLELAGKGLAALCDHPGLRNGLNVHCGRVTYRPVAESLGLPLRTPKKRCSRHEAFDDQRRIGHRPGQRR